MLFNYSGIPEKRAPWVDFAKGVAIVLVVYKHVILGLEASHIFVPQYFTEMSRIIYSFRMPLFFILSGVFVRRSLQKKGFLKFSGDRLKSLMYPYIIWALIYVSIQVMISNYTNSSRELIDYTYILYRPRYLDHLWFFYILFAISISYMLTYKLVKGNLTLIVVIAFVLYTIKPYFEQFSTALMGKAADSLEILKEIMNYFIFYSIGDIMASGLKSERFKKTFVSIPLVLFLLTFFSIGQYFLLNNDNIHRVPFAFIAISGSLFTIALGMLYGHKRIFSVLRVIGFHSMYIFILHLMVCSGIRIIFSHLLKNTNPFLLIFLETTMGILLPIIFFNTTKKYLSFLFHLKS